MARYEVTSPDGQKYEITAPDDASQEQVMSYAQSQWKQPTAAPVEPSIMEQAKNFAMKNWHLFVPGGAGMKLMEELNKGAYKAGGGVTDIAMQKGASPEVAAGLGFATNVGIQSLPVIAGAALGSQAAPKMQQEARNLMASAVKPTYSQWESGEAKRAIDTLLKEGISPTEGGVEALKSRINDINKQVEQAIANSTETANVPQTGYPLLDVLKRFSKQVAAQDDLASIKRVWALYRNNPLIAGRNDIPVQLAQQLKQGTYRQLEGKYGELSSAETEAQKAIARGLKDEIVSKIPALKDLNAKESELLNALTVSERRALLDLNQNPGGLVWLYHHPQAAAGYLAARSAPFKAMVARMLYRTPTAIPSTAGALVGGTADIVNQTANPPQ